MNAENQDVLLDLEGEEEEGEEEEDDDDGETVLELNRVVIPTYGTVPDQQNLHTPEWADFDDKPDSLFFSDGQRRIDFVLVYEDENKKITHKRSDRKKQKHILLHIFMMVFKHKGKKLTEAELLNQLIP